MRGRHILAGSLVAASALYGALFTLSTRLDPGAAWSRFDQLVAAGRDQAAAPYGARALTLWKDERGAADLEKQLEIADAHYRGGYPSQAADLYRASLDSTLKLSPERRIVIEHRVAVLRLGEGAFEEPSLIAASFLERSGDAPAAHDDHQGDEHSKKTQSAGGSYKSQGAQYLALVDSLAEGFVDALPIEASTERTEGTEAERLAVAEAMTALGGYYAYQPSATYAAAGLLSAAHRERLHFLGPNHADSVQTALLLARVFEKIGRLSGAEDLYEQVFQAQERAKGSNNPELSLYIRLLAEIYEKQGRLTEAEALNRHMRQIFRDAFGDKRYSANRSRDRLFAINRPVSPAFPLSSDYAPSDLVEAGLFGVPLSKPGAPEEMKIRRAAFGGTTMPAELASLLEACTSPDERLSLRSAYRSHRTQKQLHERNQAKGTVAEPGTSEHQTGLAVDIDVNRRFMRAADRSYACFETKAWQYGFILSFPPGNTYLTAADSYEPWHWRYVGKRTALLYREMGPWGQPQEFLAALPCYEERALSGMPRDRERGDICMKELQTAANDLERDS